MGPYGRREVEIDENSAATSTTVMDHKIAQINPLVESDRVSVLVVACHDIVSEYSIGSSWIERDSVAETHS